MNCHSPSTMIPPPEAAGKPVFDYRARCNKKHIPTTKRRSDRCAQRIPVGVTKKRRSKLPKGRKTRGYGKESRIKAYAGYPRHTPIHGDRQRRSHFFKVLPLEAKISSWLQFWRKSQIRLVPQHFPWSQTTERRVYGRNQKCCQNWLVH